MNEALSRRGIAAHPQYQVGSRSLDFAIFYGDVRLDLKVDGPPMARARERRPQDGRPDARPDRLFLDLLSGLEAGGASAEVDVGGGQVADALVVAVVTVVLDEGGDGGIDLARQELALGSHQVVAQSRYRKAAAGRFFTIIPQINHS